MLLSALRIGIGPDHRPASSSTFRAGFKQFGMSLKPLLPPILSLFVGILGSRFWKLLLFFLQPIVVKNTTIVNITYSSKKKRKIIIIIIIINRIVTCFPIGKESHGWTRPLPVTPLGFLLRSGYWPWHFSAKHLLSSGDTFHPNPLWLPALFSSHDQGQGLLK